MAQSDSVCAVDNRRLSSCTNDPVPARSVKSETAEAPTNGQWSALAVQLLPLIAVYLLLSFKIAPAIAIVVFAILFVRAIIGLFDQAELTPKKLSISEIAFDTFAALLVGAGYRFGW